LIKTVIFNMDGKITVSQEFTGKNTSNKDFLVVLYRAFFNREPDANG
jgi:hypothetical protein